MSLPTSSLLDRLDYIPGQIRNYKGTQGIELLDHYFAAVQHDGTNVGGVTVTEVHPCHLQKEFKRDPHSIYLSPNKDALVGVRRTFLISVEDSALRAAGLGQELVEWANNYFIETTGEPIHSDVGMPSAEGLGREEDDVWWDLHCRGKAVPYILSFKDYRRDYERLCWRMLPPKL